MLALDSGGQPIDVTGLMLVAERIEGSTASLSVTSVIPDPFVTGLYTGLLRVSLSTDDAAIAVRLGVSGFDESAGVVVETARVDVLRSLGFSAAASTLTEGGAAVELRIDLPAHHVGRQVELTLVADGTAVVTEDYSLLVSDPSARLIVGSTKTISLRLDGAPANLGLLLRPRMDDPDRQGDQIAELRISRYRVDGEDDRSVILPDALTFRILDDELLSVSLVITEVLPPATELPPLAEAVVELRVKANVRGSDGRPFVGLKGLGIRVETIAVTDGDGSHVDVSTSPISETVPGSYEGHADNSADRQPRQRGKPADRCGRDQDKHPGRRIVDRQPGATAAPRCCGTDSIGDRSRADHTRGGGAGHGDGDGARSICSAFHAD